VEGLNPVRFAVNEPTPPGSEYFVLAVVGEGVVDQQSPLLVTGEPLSDETVPPHEAEV
jgi:hypothetical protein